MATFSHYIIKLSMLALIIIIIKCPFSVISQTLDSIDIDVLHHLRVINNGYFDINNNVNNDTEDMGFSLNPSKYEYKYPCPGLAAGFECDYSSSWSSRDGDHFFCDADVIHINDLTYERFMNEYLFKKPLLIDANLSDWTDPSFWTKHHWLNKYGKYPFQAGRSLELVLNAGVGADIITLEEYFEDHMQIHLDEDEMGPYDAKFKEPLYVFDRTIWRNEENFQLNYFRGPQYLFNSLETQYGILFIGVTGTGATWHAHTETWAGIAYGRKRWFLYPPEVQPPGGFWPSYSTKDWFINIYPYLHDNLTWIQDTKDWNNHFVQDEGKRYGTNDPNKFGDDGFLRRFVHGRVINGTHYESLNSHSTIKDILSADAQFNHNGLHKPFECIQKEGQLIYLPDYWWHAVINIGDVIAGGIQASDSYTVWTKEIQDVGKNEVSVNDESMKQKHQNPLTELEKFATQYELLKIHDRLGYYAPYNAVHQFFVGYQYIKIEQYIKAAHYIREALLMDPAFIEAYVALSKIYAWTKSAWYNYLGERLLRIAYILNPNHPTVRKQLIKIFNKQKQYDLVELVLKHEPLPDVDDLTEADFAY